MAQEEGIVRDEEGLSDGRGFPEGWKSGWDEAYYQQFMRAMEEGGDAFEDFRTDFIRNMGFRRADRERMYELVNKYGRTLIEGTGHEKGLIDGMCDTINLQLKRDASFHGYKHFYSKTGLVNNEFLHKLLSRFQERSMSGEYDDGAHRLRAFVVNLDKETVKKQGKEFYLKLAADIAAAMEKVPEYANDAHARKLVDEIKRNKPGAVYGEKFRFWAEDKDDILGESALFKKDWNVVGNLFGFTETLMNGRTSEQLPLFLPVVNMDWPESYCPANHGRLTEALRSYASKRHYSHSEERMKTFGKITPFEERVAEEAGYASNYFGSFASDARRGPMVMFGHSWFVGALPYNPEGESWCGYMLANDCFLEELGNVARRNLIKIV